MVILPKIFKKRKSKKWRSLWEKERNFWIQTSIILWETEVIEYDWKEKHLKEQARQSAGLNLDSYDWNSLWTYYEEALSIVGVQGKIKPIIWDATLVVTRLVRRRSRRPSAPVAVIFPKCSENFVPFSLNHSQMVEEDNTRNIIRIHLWIHFKCPSCMTNPLKELYSVLRERGGGRMRWKALMAAHKKGFHVGTQLITILDWCLKLSFRHKIRFLNR